MVKILFSECSSFLWVDTAEYLTKEFGWKPVYWTALPDFEKHIKKKFPDAIYHSTIDAIRGINSPSCVSIDIPALDQPLLEKLAFCESIVIPMMDRMDINRTFTYTERKNLYYSYVRYWSGVLDLVSPDVYISPVSPHVIYDYVLYSLCKMRDIKTIMFNQPSLYGWVYPIEHFEEMPKSIQNVYKNVQQTKETSDLASFTLSNQSEYYLNKTSSDYSTAIPFYMKEQFEQNQIGVFLLKKLITNPDKAADMIQKVITLFSKDHYVKQKAKNIKDSNMKGFEYIWNRMDGVKKKNQLRQHYKILQQQPDLTSQYIYVALHYQPENSTSPQGESFADQYLLVDLLSKCLPSGWNIYVKEHSSQWHIKLHGERSRTIDFYDALAALPNVRIIPVDSPNFDLIDNAKAVATVTGTTGWESVVRGKPVLIFGHAWYKNCHGVFSVESLNDCKKAINSIINGFSIDPVKVRAFLKALEHGSIKAYLGERYKTATNITYKENVDNISLSIYSYLKKNRLEKDA